MSHELHYTSAIRGLKPGSQGFCVVATTANLPGPVVERLEGLSGYRAAFPPGHPSARLNPAVVSHRRLSVIGQSYNVLSWVGDAGLDYSGRGNKYAHHVAIEAAERPAAGPAWLAASAGFLDKAWSGEPRVLPKGRTPPAGDRLPTTCDLWARRFGDAGWAGEVAQGFLDDPNRSVYFLFNPGEDLLPLFAQAIALLPRDQRWGVTFSTYFTGQDQGAACLWRAVLRDSPEAEQANRQPGVLILDPASPPRPATSGPLVEQARTGIPPRRFEAAAVPTIGPRPPGRLPSSAPSSSPDLYENVPDYVPAISGRPRPGEGKIRPRARPAKFDRDQILVWGGAAFSLIFLIGAATAWVVLQPKPPIEVARRAGLDGHDKGTTPIQDPPTTPTPPQPQVEKPPIGTGVPTGKTAAQLVQDASPGPAEKHAPANPADPEANQATPSANGTETEGVEKTKVDKTQKPAGERPNTQVVSDVPQLRSWDIRSGAPLEARGQVKEIKLLPDSKEASIKLRSRDSTIVHRVGYDRDLIKISIEGNVLKREIKFEPDSAVNDYDMLGQCVLKMMLNDGTDEYVLLQKSIRGSQRVAAVRPPARTAERDQAHSVGAQGKR